MVRTAVLKGPASDKALAAAEARAAKALAKADAAAKAAAAANSKAAAIKVAAAARATRADAPHKRRWAPGSLARIEGNKLRRANRVLVRSEGTRRLMEHAIAAAPGSDRGVRITPNAVFVARTLADVFASRMVGDALAATMHRTMGKPGRVTLRDVHAAAPPA